MFEFVKLHRNKIHKFRPKIQFVSDKGPFLIKTVTETDELIEALRLRYQVFHREMMGKSKPYGIDVDEFDFVCDHLAIIEKKTGNLIGTYRLNCSSFSEQFYSAQEFDLGDILQGPGVKMELGRACIQKEYRRGLVISLLWRGIAEYMTATQADMLFGCASIKTESPRQGALLYHYFRQEGRFNEKYQCPPTAKFLMPNIDLWIDKLARPLTAEELSEIDELIPPLCRAYLKAGALLGGTPAYDADFKCIDFLTILPRELLNRALWRKYNPCQNGQDEPNRTSDPTTPAL